MENWVNYHFISIKVLFYFKCCEIRSVFVLGISDTRIGNISNLLLLSILVTRFGHLSNLLILSIRKGLCSSAIVCSLGTLFENQSNLLFCPISELWLGISIIYYFIHKNTSPFLSLCEVPYFRILVSSNTFLDNSLI